MTNVLSLMDGIIEARCAFVVGSARLARSRPPGSATGLSGLSDSAGLTRTEMRELIRRMLYPIDARVTYDDMLELVAGNELRISRQYAATSVGATSEIVPYDKVISDKLSESERRVLLLLIAHYRVVMLQEFESIVKTILDDAGNARLSADVNEILKGNGDRLPSPANGSH